MPWRKYAIIGAGEVGLETAEFMTNELNKKVYVFEILEDYGKDMNPNEKIFLLQRLEKSSIEIFTQSNVKK
jgi:pyruvate/2-oxoglutarate dehydrogenase complex dihydrolipoamide dehydrogenase (E3) component